MATSGSVNFNLTRNDIINEAAEIAMAKDFVDDLSADEVSSCARTLNIMIKSWQSLGMSIWKNETIYVFLNTESQTYDIGPTGDHATTSFVKTEVSTAASSGDSTIDVDSITGISDADIIGVELDGGDLQWTTVNGAPSGSTITLTASLTDDVAVDRNVFTYTTITNRPLYITKALFHLDSGSETPIDVYSKMGYEELTTKDSTSNQTTICYYEPLTTNGKLHVWPLSTSVKNYIKLIGRMPIEDFDAAGNDMDFPQEWGLALTWNLARLIAPKFQIVPPPDVSLLADKFLKEAQRHDKDWASNVLKGDYTRRAR